MANSPVPYTTLAKRSSTGSASRTAPSSKHATVILAALLVTIALLGVMWASSLGPHFPAHHLVLLDGPDSARPALELESMLPLPTISRTLLTAGMEAGSWSIGPCHGRAAQLAMPDLICEPLHCLRSPLHPSIFLDMWFKVMTPSNDSSLMDSCSEAAGGQVGHLPGHPIQVSFVITFRDKVQMTMQCLLELFRTAREADSVEFVIVNDGSMGDTSAVDEFGRRIMLFFGVPFRVIHNAVSLGYGAANNMGVQQARGKYVVLLNNDAYVTPGWLYALLKTMQANPKVGVAGPLFVSSKGEVMEAGGVVYANSMAANYGRGMQPNHRHLYSRPVDYISAACIMIERNLFLQVQGFDAAYQRGYWEDTDLAFAVSALGYAVQYQPLSVVVHNEGGSLSSEKQALMMANQQIFKNKWHAKLEMQHCPPTQSLDTAAARLTGAFRILWIDDIVPEPDRDSGSIRTYNILQLLRDAGFAVSYQAVTSRDSKYQAQARFEGMQVLPVSDPHQWVMQHDGRCLYDAIFIARFYVFESVGAVVQRACRSTPIIFDTVDLHFLREARMALSSKHRWNFGSTDLNAVETWLKSSDPQAVNVAFTQHRELHLVEVSSVTVVVSEQEVKLLQRLAPKAVVKVISNVHKVDDQKLKPRDCAARQGMLFVGNFNHLPNQQAVEALVEDVLPELYNWLPASMKESLVLHIVGSNRSPTINLDHAKIPIIYHGWLSDQQLQLLYSSVKVVVAPLMSGAGVKGKINQAMLYGVPVVATPVAAEGMHLVDGENAMLAATPREFAQKLLQVYTDCDMWNKIVTGGFSNIRQYYGMQAAAAALKEVLAEVQLPAAAAGSRCY